MNSGNISKDEKSTQIQLEFNISKIKSDVILKKIFNQITKKKSLKIIKGYSKILKRLNIDIKDYKNYCEIYSSIEIELKPVDNAYGEFINIPDENKAYYHIYFDNSKKEIKRNYLNLGENVEKIKIIIDHQIKSLKSLFFKIRCISSINFKKFHRINITDMKFMFCFCTSLRELNLSNLITNDVTDMRYMFRGCDLLKKLNLSNFNTAKVTNMSYMFSECTSLEELNISNFNTDKVTNMSCMFYGCSSLKELNISNFKISYITKTFDMFKKCSSELINNFYNKIK